MFKYNDADDRLVDEVRSGWGDGTMYPIPDDSHR